ncbi:hypothetical protein [Hymenobacter cellulosivorans]|uniref:DUF4369 domain-containing protein n=1 Tax=Hymenobacter cellulosivorans TaxID=2932249 RepID=A0ABY4FGB8_9BACT|nr:hypothetical protein [Hymenobacter cellulosivorans]UOQ55053.1 hypothetical protein MUN80_09910 [Hymenobacter cellulosivorans]
MKAILPLLALTALLTTSCSEDKAGVIAPEGCSSLIVKENVDGRGLVLYDVRERVYTIQTSVPGTPDGQIVGFVCGVLPEAFRQDSLLVSFTGTYTQFNKYSPPVASQEYYYLSLSRLEAIKGE